MANDENKAAPAVDHHGLVGRLEGALDRYEQHIDPKTRLPAIRDRFAWESTAAAMADDIRDILRSMPTPNAKADS